MPRHVFAWVKQAWCKRRPCRLAGADAPRRWRPPATRRCRRVGAGALPREVQQAVAEVSSRVTGPLAPAVQP